MTMPSASRLYFKFIVIRLVVHKMTIVKWAKECFRETEGTINMDYSAAPQILTSLPLVAQSSLP